MQESINAPHLTESFNRNESRNLKVSVETKKVNNFFPVATMVSCR